MRTGETKKKHKCQTSLKKASLNSCSVTAALEISFAHPGSRSAVLKQWVACRNITTETSRQD